MTLKHKKCRRKCCVSARARIEQLENALRHSEYSLKKERENLQSATNNALQMFIQNSNVVNDASVIITEKLAEALGKELMPYAQKLLRSANQDGRPLMSFYAPDNAAYQEKKVTVISGEIKPLRFNVAMGF